MGTPRRVHRRRHSRGYQPPSPTAAAIQQDSNTSNNNTHNTQHEESENAKNQSMFSPEQQKVIIEHLLITKNSAPQKNYSHVPCKFYRQGVCQAGQSCPFSHSLDAFAADQRPCEYFKRGNCKFGAKCVNAHVTSEGTDAKKPLKQFSPPSRITTNIPSATPSVPQGNPAIGTSMIPQQQTDLADVFEDEEYFLPNDFSDLLTPEELSHRRSRSSSSNSLKLDPISAASSLTSEPLFHHQRSLSGTSTTSSSSSFTSPLLHQQLAFFQSAQSTQVPLKSPYNYTYATRPLQFKSQHTWGSMPSSGPPSSSSSSSSYPFSFANDLAKFRIEEEDTPFLLDGLPSNTFSSF
ncbi:hypothetical protein ZYGR_0S02770 [Zygosaccharomyces rouxii]|uniref:ZYRO0F08690p n=2 Tax=Zygosaccharomyces rouxii TaxID=4956 RepID=C5DXY2_ZYGRC|nr:uncharacterized protein ZYRO0F08690g [Zygosaccharomyces rouxii]KAH9199400.1 hypothetical protein LQ764DRAFT_225636 [Zygosaccharomyces rouxii]GAV50143.1 hypothetical protein ZYGR_0S02770 [Zygosaccharomyces rouxii]CAR28643.1 ZYRO0F08690p [Zygosaccharomyces rouxii]